MNRQVNHSDGSNRYRTLYEIREARVRFATKREASMMKHVFSLEHSSQLLFR